MGGGSAGAKCDQLQECSFNYAAWTSEVDAGLCPCQPNGSRHLGKEQYAEKDEKDARSTLTKNIATVLHI